MSANSGYGEIILINEAYFSSLIADIDAAEVTIDLETYIYSDDVMGKKVAEALCQAANRGVKVRILVDGIGTQNWKNELTDQMEKSGILTRVYHPIPWVIKHWDITTRSKYFFLSNFIHLLTRMNSRNHRKTCVIDNNIVYVGSANITYYDNSSDRNILALRDTSIKLINVEAGELHYAFEKAWGSVPLKKSLRDFIRRPNAYPIFRLNFTWRRRHALHKALMKIIENSKKRIWITNAYLVPDNRLLKYLTKAARNGVDVRIILPSKYDIPVMSYVAKTFYSFLLEAGVGIFEYTPGILHAKSLILDDWFCVGSTNLNYRSFKHDLEIDVNVRTSEAKIDLEKQFLSDLRQSQKILKSDIQKLSIFQKMIGRLLLLISYWL